jgi:hypothetical protein
MPPAFILGRSSAQGSSPLRALSQHIGSPLTAKLHGHFPRGVDCGVPLLCSPLTTSVCLSSSLRSRNHRPRAQTPHTPPHHPHMDMQDAMALHSALQALQDCSRLPAAPPSQVPAPMDSLSLYLGQSLLDELSFGTRLASRQDGAGGSPASSVMATTRANAGALDGRPPEGESAAAFGRRLASMDGPALRSFASLRGRRRPTSDHITPTGTTTTTTPYYHRQPILPQPCPRQDGHQLPH